MTRLVVGTLGLVISFILFMGVNVVNLLSGDQAAQYVGQATVEFFKDWQLWFYGGVALLFTMQQLWLRIPKPVSLSAVEDLRSPVELLLKNVLNRYYTTMSQYSQSSPSVRTNIMLPTWRPFRLGRYLKIYYSNGGPAGIRYPDQELDLTWVKNDGTCGYAWAQRRTVIYDSENEAFKAPEKRLTYQQKQTVGNIKSVLSVPIWSKMEKRVIAILNLDSTWNVDRTLFHQEELIQILEAWSRVFSTMIFVDGVKAH